MSQFAAPSPSQLLVLWEDVKEVIAVFVRLIDDPFSGACRRKIARLLFESQAELADSTAGRSGADIPVVSSDDWSDYSSWSLQLRHQHASEEVTSADWNRVQPALCIESVAACRDKEGTQQPRSNNLFIQALFYFGLYREMHRTQRGR